MTLDIGLKATLDAMRDPVAVVDTDHNLLLANKALLQTLGQQDVVGKKCYQVLHGQDNPVKSCICHQALGSKSSETQEIQLKDRWYEYAALPVTNQSGRVTHFVVTMHDITQHLQQKERLQETRAKAEAASRAKSQFVANVSHEIRTPMNAVLGMVQLLDGTRLDAKQKKFVQLIRGGATNLLDIVNEILDYSKLEAGKLSIEPRQFNLTMLIDSVLGLLRLEAEKKHLLMKCQLEEGIPNVVLGDPGRLRQVLVNLLGNAIKFTDRGEINLRVEKREDLGNHCLLMFSVTDTGVGIAPDKLELIFQSFCQADSSSVRRHGGTGLGLTISRQLVEMMGGTIEVDSQLHRGSSFRFTTRLGVEITPHQHLSRESRKLNGMRVLLVAKFDTSMEQKLKGWGCCCCVTPEIGQAVPLLQQAIEQKQPYAVLIVDTLALTQEDLELGARVHDSTVLNQTALVVRTRSGQRGDAAAAETSGYAAYLADPIGDRVWISCLQTVLLDRDEMLTRHSVVERQRSLHRILVVDDNEMNQTVALAFLDRLGFSSQAVGNGQEALVQLEQTDFDLVLMDIQMPIMDGMEATRLIRDPQSNVKNHQVPLVAMTAHGMESDLRDYIDKGMNDYLTKPVELTNLSGVLQKLLGS